MPFTKAQIKNLLKSPAFFAEQAANQLNKPIVEKEEQVGLTKEQVKNLLKNPLFLAEHSAYSETSLKPSR